MDNQKQQQNFSKQANSKACLSAEPSRKSADLQLNKTGSRNSRRREHPTTSKNDQQRSSKQQQSVLKVRPNVDKRPRARVGGDLINGSGGGASTKYDDFLVAPGTGLALTEVESSLGGAAFNGARGGLGKISHLDYESDSVYAHGSKKNLNHLLKFHYGSRESDYSMGNSVFGRGRGSKMSGGRHGYAAGTGSSRKHAYNKEQFMQANFQFVIKSNAKPKLTASPDTMIDWNFIEQINIQTTEEPQCPICLYPPIAAKLTRCGHAYCWPCILHYLALSDKTWRKCPICYEAIHTSDLKSTTIVQQQEVKIGDHISFHLMRRKKGSLFTEKYISAEPSLERYPACSTNDEAKLFSKFLIAKRADILDIIEREHSELLTDEDSSCPEFVFIQQALDLLKERREALGSDIVAKAFMENEVPSAKNSVESRETHKIEGMAATVNEIVAFDDSSKAKADKVHTEVAVNEVASTIVSDDSAVLQNIAATSAKYYYFYQSIDGQNIFLHPLNVKMLQACYGTLDHAPLFINAYILQKEHHSMDEDHRRKFTCLGHLPLTCQFAVVEVDLRPPLVTDTILKLFKDDILSRKKERQRREREERKREKQIDEINDRQMGKLITSTGHQLNLGSSNEFPLCGFEESLLSANSQDVAAPCSAAASTTKRRQATYSSVAIVSESPKLELWTALPSPTSSTYNSYQSLSSWGKSTTPTVTRQAPPDIMEKAVNLDPDTDLFLSPTNTNLGDVLAEAFSQKKNGTTEKSTGSGSANKKNKKSKKMMPLFSTGMNFGGK